MKKEIQRCDELAQYLNVPVRGIPMAYPSQQAFLNMSTAEVAQLVQKAGTQVCVCPIDGTRRWFLMERGGGSYESYLDAMMQCLIDVSALLLEHGLNTLLVPSFGFDQLKRGPSYLHMVEDGLTRMASHPALLHYYATKGIRVSFYGDYRVFLPIQTGDGCLA